jgi:Tfp pilus assembly protein PilP
MTVRTGICVLALTACAAWAQSGSRDTIAAVNKQVKVSAGATSNVVAGKPGQPKAAAIATKPRRVKKAVPRTKNAKKTANAEPRKEKDQPVGSPEREARSINMRGQRDPFETIVQNESVVTCTTGKKCLMVNKIDLKGTVQSSSGMIAVVENQGGKTYFLHENDPVFNGQVVKINSDSIVFRETVTDKAGRHSEKEIVKRLFGPPAG